MKTLALILLLSATSCINVGVKEHRIEKATGVRLTPPPEPFSPQPNPKADQLWISTKTGNSIAWFSECNHPTDPSSESIKNDYLTIFERLKVESEEITEHQGREAWQVTGSGRVDGVATKFSMKVFKKGTCNYTLLYTGRPKTFDAELSYFNSFIKEFFAP
ncbi:MAG: hypothetical protein N2578_00220 [Bdellovibrionaceae bacterium]|nr:hypothetical protein [Pseudobdellovibrionaceae bacterium]